jgi:hypothetical protein
MKSAVAKSGEPLEDQQALLVQERLMPPLVLLHSPHQQPQPRQGSLLEVM